MGQPTKAIIKKEYKHNDNVFQLSEVHEGMFYEWTVLINGRVASRCKNIDIEDEPRVYGFYDGAVQSYKMLNGVI